MRFTSRPFSSKFLYNCHHPSHKVNGTVTYIPGPWPSFTNWVSEAWATWIFLICQGIREGWGISPPVSFSTDTVIFSWAPGINLCPASLHSQGFSEASSGFMTWILVPSTESSFPCCFSMISSNLTIPCRSPLYPQNQVPELWAGILSSYRVLVHSTEGSSNVNKAEVFTCLLALRVCWCPFHVKIQNDNYFIKDKTDKQRGIGTRSCLSHWWDHPG